MDLGPLIITLSRGKGLYVPLIGSGVSTGAGVLTGNQVMKDLLGQLARVGGQDGESDLEEWYRRTYGEEANYSRVLEKLTQTPAERAQVLASYFVPSDDDRRLGRKVPTRAHRALARLARAGYVRLVLTTNFDTLIEQAMGSEGLEPVVVSRSDDVEGLPPLSHVPLCVVKVHGDYRDYRTLNTSAELASYPGALDAFLRRILTDYGLIVCGWSGQYDAALLRIVRECRSAHYGTHWAYRREITGEAAEIVAARGGQGIAIVDGDTFLGEIADGVEALERTARQATTGSDITEARLRQYLQAENRWIDLDDLMSSELREVLKHLDGERFRFDGEAFNENTLAARILEYEAVTVPLARLLLAGTRWGRVAHDKIWLECIRRLIPDVEFGAGSVGWMDLADYPALIALYAAGLGALSAQRADLAMAALKGGPLRHAHEDRPWVFRLHQWFVDTRWFGVLPGMAEQPEPVSERLWQVLNPLLVAVNVAPKATGELFDDWELLLSLTTADERERAFGNPRTPVGRFAWKHHGEGNRSVVERFRMRLTTEGREWPYVRAGLCGGDAERALVLLDAIAQQQELQQFYYNFPR